MRLTHYRPEQYQAEPLAEPKGKFQKTIRHLAEDAVSRMLHDMPDDSPEHINAVRSLERSFGNYLRGKLKP